MIHEYSERDICTKLIAPAILAVGWQQEQLREEVTLTDEQVIVRGKVAKRLLAQFDRVATGIRNRQNTTAQLLNASIHLLLRDST